MKRASSRTVEWAIRLKWIFRTYLASARLKSSRVASTFWETLIAAALMFEATRDD